jgi:hypothetical protein
MKPRAAAGVWKTFHCSRFGRLPELGNEFSLVALAPLPPRPRPFTEQKQVKDSRSLGTPTPVLLHESGSGKTVGKETGETVRYL